MKRILSTLLMTVLLLGMLPTINIPISAEEYVEEHLTYRVVDGEVTITRCNTSVSGVFEIPVTLGDCPVVAIGNYAFSNCYGLTSIVIPDGVISIGEEAFYNCSNLISVVIPDSVRTIGFGAFNSTAYYMNSSNWEDNILYIDNYLIKANVGLSGDISIKDGTKCLAFGAFNGCDGMVSVTIPDSVISINLYAFDGCINLEKVYINDIDNWCNIVFETYYDKIYSSNYTCNPLYYAKELYINETLLENLVIPTGTETINEAVFYGYSGLISVTIPDSVTIVGENAFYGCTGLTSVSISDNVAIIGEGAFRGCTGLTSVAIPDSVTTIGRDAFFGCVGLTSLFLPGSMSDFSLAFSGCTNLKKIYITDLKAWCSQTFKDRGNPLFHNEGLELYLNDSLVEDLVIPDGVTTINYRAFANFACLTSITIPDSVVTISNYAFNGCTGLTKVVLPQSVVSVGDSAFYNCSSLETVQYAGTQLERAYISIGNNNSPFLQANWTYREWTNPFTDVPAGQYYTDPVLWAVGKKITNGMDATHFAPDNSCTRGQIVTFLWRAAGSPAPQSSRNPFVDVPSNQYYYKAVLWAVEKGITTGMDATHFAPDAFCTRGQIVTFLWRAKGKPLASSSNPFYDVSGSAYYYSPVLWAVKNGITTGMSATSFAPDAPCTRAQIVTFLYRAYK